MPPKVPRPDPAAAFIERTLRDWRVIAALGAVLLIAPVPLVWLGWPWIRPLLESQFWFSLILGGLAVFIVIHLDAAFILAERKLSAFIQDRKGPNRVGFWGLLQPVADGIKFLLKEDYTPKQADKPVFILAPALAFVISLAGVAIIPWFDQITWPWTGPDGETYTVVGQMASLDIGLLYLLAFGAMSVYGVVLAGWASNNKYAFYGAMRATAQMLSYEIPLGLGLLAVLLVAGSVRLEGIVESQAASGVWNVFVHPLAFLLVLIAGFAETNRAPFDLAECEQELVAGYHTEYSSMKFALFFLAEYSHMVIGSALVTALFLGGWAPLPFTSWLADNHTWWAGLIKFSVFWGKILLLIGLYMVVRWTLPRFRFDQLMRLAWKGMIPLGMVIVVVQGIATGLGWRIDPAAPWTANLLAGGLMLGINILITLGVLWLMSRSRAPVTGRQDNLPDVIVPPAEARLAR
ncbi:MAG: NADH-quinone oxidoreductase subunit NuoH [Phycisphaerae bacterium]|nr:NADH-quinone oxidoreductase subunit NuoH [Phycisphaerae bacterium]NUQ48621.1 NADH-quinone oxidoreductase subunit NuoH [Phycisphaerae bacterium]